MTASLLVLVAIPLWTRNEKQPGPTHAPQTLARSDVPTPSRDTPAGKSAPVTVQASVVRTRAGVLDTYRPAADQRVVAISDEQLLEALADIGRPAGLIRTGDRAWLTREVADRPAIDRSQSRARAPERLS